MITCSCPAAAALPDVPKVTCSEGFGQIQKVAFQRLTAADGTKNKFTTTKAITALASWTALTSASDGTKVVLSPYIQAPTSEGGAARTFGGGNDTLGGVQIIVGRESTPFSGVLRNIPQSVIKALKELQCESASGNLGVYLIDENGAIEALGGATGEYFPIPIDAFFVGDKTHGGLESPDGNNISWSFKPNWSDDLKIVTPAFNPLTDL